METSFRVFYWQFPDKLIPGRQISNTLEIRPVENISFLAVFFWVTFLLNNYSQLALHKQYFAY
jgi:hypothetical protein